MTVILTHTDSPIHYSNSHTGDPPFCPIQSPDNQPHKQKPTLMLILFLPSPLTRMKQNPRPKITSAVTCDTQAPSRVQCKDTRKGAGPKKKVDKVRKKRPSATTCSHKRGKRAEGWIL